MPSNEDRKAVAAKLRRLEEENHWERARFIVGFIDAIGLESRASVGECLLHLADLIESEERTCEVMHWGGGVFYLSCGHDSREWPKPNYCPSCGARVIGG